MAPLSALEALKFWVTHTLYHSIRYYALTRADVGDTSNWLLGNVDSTGSAQTGDMTLSSAKRIRIFVSV